MFIRARTPLPVPLPLFFLLFLCLPLPAEAQVPYENGYSLKEAAGGLKGPSSIAVDGQGRVYVASIFDANGPGKPTDIYRVLPDGTVETFTAPLLDPDVLCLDGAGYVYVGAWPGRITRIDPATGTQEVWVYDTQLGNIDGLAFDGAGRLLVTAIDHSKIHRIDPSTKAVSLFADLTALGLQGFGSIAVDPSDQSVYVASPKDGDLVHLNPDGSLDAAAVASGFQHMGQLAVEGTSVFISDNVAGRIYRLDRTTGALHLFVEKIHDLGGGFAVLGEGEYYATHQTEDMSQGWLYRIRPMSTALGTAPVVGGTLDLHMQSPADAGRPAALFITVSQGNTLLPDGRLLPVDLSSFLLFQSVFDPAGAWTFLAPIPNKAEFHNLQLHATYVSIEGGVFGISKRFSLTIM